VAICEWEPESALLKHPNEVSVLLECDASTLDVSYPMIRHSMMVVSRLQRWDHHAALKYPALIIQRWGATSRNNRGHYCILYWLYLTYIRDWPRVYQCHVQGRPLARSRSAKSVFVPRWKTWQKNFTLNRKDLLLIELSLFPFYGSKTV
jgi:hypothetical protein